MFSQSNLKSGMSETISNRILIAGSNIINLKILESKLNVLGFDVLKATDGNQALKMASEFQPDMIILDPPLSGVDSYKVCQTLKKRNETRRILVIFATDASGRVSHVKAAEVGADEFIMRPYDQVILSLRLKTLMGTKSLNEEFAELQTDLELKVAQRTVEAMEASDAGLFALAKLAESRDMETGKHLDRIRRYSVVLTNELVKMFGFEEQISKGFIANIYRSSPLHDIGKVGIPDSILLKPGRLTIDEFEIMKTHSTIGSNILKEAYNMMQNKPYFELAWIIALTHHEKWNGTGYPQGLKEQDIPLAGRIVALADTYDAMVSKRIYKEAFSHEKAKQFITEESGKHFDPRVVQAFLNAEDQFLEVKRRYSDNDHS